MSVLIFADQTEGHIKKISFEALSYGAALAKQQNIPCYAVVLGNVNDNLIALGKYGVSKVFSVTDDVYNHFDAQVYTKAIAAIATAKIGCFLIACLNNASRSFVKVLFSTPLKVM